MSINYIIVNKKEDLSLYWDDIQALFKVCFKKDMDYSVWEWANLFNPFGEPLTILAYFKDNLVGHYSFIPQEYIYNKSIIKTYLSINTMVKRDAIKYNVFYNMVEIANKIAKDNSYNYILGFPNKKAVNGLKKRMSWDIGEIDTVYSLKKSDLISYFNKKSIYNNSISINLSNKFKQWRLSKKGKEYIDLGTILKKNSETNLDILYLDNLDFLKEDIIYNILLPSNIHEFRDKIKFNYQFGMKPITNDIKKPFRKDLIMTDIF